METRHPAPPVSDARPQPAPPAPAPRRRWETPRLERAAIDTTQNTPGALADGITTSSLIP